MTVAVLATQTQPMCIDDAVANTNQESRNTWESNFKKRIYIRELIGSKEQTS